MIERKAVQTTEAAVEMFPPSKKLNALSRNPAAEDRTWLYNELRDFRKLLVDVP